MTRILIRGGRLIDPSQGWDKPGDLLLEKGKVAWAGEDPTRAYGDTPLRNSAVTMVLEAKGMVVCPGFIDLHCHLREPGFEEKETIATGTQAAARGGFTTLCSMPNTRPPIDSAAAVDFVLKQAAAQGCGRVLPIGCISRGQQGEELAEMGELAKAGVVAFSDDGRPVMSSRLMRHALEYSLAFGLPIIEHCEDLSLTEGGAMNEGWVSARLGLPGMPAAAEVSMVARDIALVEAYSKMPLSARAHGSAPLLHLAHLSTEGAVELLRLARAKGLPVTAEVTPHHLTLTEERVMGNGILGYDTNAKVNPPLRTERDRQALVAALREGLVDAIATDHAPHAIVDKACEFELAAFGISGLETALGSLLSLVHKGELELATLIARLTQGPARILGRQDLGTLKVGAVADVTLFDPQAEWLVDPQAFASKGKNTPLAGCLLKGKVMATIYGGRVVYADPALKTESTHAG